MIKAHNPNNLPTIDYRDLIELQPNSFKDLSQKNFDKLSNSFNVHGFITPYFVWKYKGKHFILDGHQRSRVLSTLEPNGLEVPYILIEAKNKQEAAKKLLAIDSRYGKRTAEGEQEFLDIFEIEQGYIEEVAVLEFEFETEDTEVEAKEDDFDVPQGGFKTDIVLGDLFEIGEHRLLCGDSTDSDQVAKLMKGEKADLGLTDPPYNLGYNYATYDDNLTSEEYNDFIIGYVSNLILFSEKQIITSGKQNVGYYYKNFDITEFAVWYAKNKMSGSKIANLGLCEPILFIGKFNRNARATDMFEFTVKQQKETGGHTCPKAMEFFSDLLNSYSDKLILDLFLGSGTTMVAAQQLKRKCYGMELDSKYAEVIVRRMIKLDNTLTIKRNGIDETQKWLSKINEASDEEE